MAAKSRMKALLDVKTLRPAATVTKRYYIVHFPDAPRNQRFRLRKKAKVISWHDGLQHATMMDRPLSDSERYMEFKRSGSGQRFNLFSTSRKLM